MSQSILPVRASDPGTSWAAAMKAVLASSKIRPVVLEVITEHGPLTHDELIAAYHHRVVMDPDTRRASESAIRTRLKELVRDGVVVEAADKGLSNFGNAAKRWVAVEPNDAVFAYLEDIDEEVEDQ